MSRPRIAVACCVVLAGCHRAPAAAEPSHDAAGGADETEGSEADAAALANPRCAPAGPPLPLAGIGLESAAPGALEVGDGVPYDGGYALGLIRSTDAGRVAAVALVDLAGHGAARHVVDLGPTLGDAPPPRLAARAGELLAGAYDVPRGGAHEESARGVTVYRVADGKVVTGKLTVPQQRDDSLAFDLASSPTARVLVWDEARSPAHGVIRAVAFAPVVADTPAPAAHDVSPQDSDAEMPRVVSTPSGLLALWVARQAEPGDAAAGASAEVTGEARGYGWLEAVSLDDHAFPVGRIRRLTPTNGHVSAFDVALLPSGGPLLVVARDDGESVDGSGGTLLRVRTAGDRVEAPLAFVTDGLGRGAPEIVDGDPPWLAWVGPQERLRLTPLDRTGAPMGPPSAEEALGEGRPLHVVGASPGAPVRLLVASPEGAAGELREFTCVINAHGRAHE